MIAVEHIKIEVQEEAYEITEITYNSNPDLKVKNESEFETIPVKQELTESQSDDWEEPIESNIEIKQERVEDVSE